MVKFYLNKELFTEDYKETGINHTAYYAVRKRKETGNKLLDFDDIIHDSDIPEIINTLKRMGEKEFTISSTFSSIVRTIAGFEELGCTLDGITKVKAPYENFGSEERELIPAFKMTIG